MNMILRYYNKIPKKYLIFILVRFISFFIIAFETFFGPKIVGIHNYGLIEYEKQLINLASILLLGIHSGYGFHYFNDDKKTNPNNFIIIGTLHSIIVFVIISIAFRNDLFSFGIIFYLVSILLEQILKIKNKFNLAILYKPTLSIILILYYIGYFVWHKTIFDFRIDLNIIYLISFIVFVLIIYPNLFKLRKQKLNLPVYIKFLKRGFEPNLTTSLIVLFLFIDRFIIDKYFNDKLGIYSIAYNFSYISFLLATSISYVTTIKFGERMKNEMEIAKYVKMLIKLTLYFLLGTCLIVVPLIYLTSIFWFKEDGFIQISLINFVAKTLFGCCAFVSPIIFYKGKERLLWGFMLLVVILTVLFDFLALKFLEKSDVFLLIQYISGIFLTLYALYVYYIIRFVLKIKLI